jgi:hypothetical protein
MHMIVILAPCSGLIVNIPSSTKCYGSNGRVADFLFYPLLNQAINAETFFFVTELHTHFVKHFRAILLHKCKSGILFD